MAKRRVASGIFVGNDSLYSGTQVGQINAFGSASGLPPTNDWLLCDGRAVSRSLYPALFRVIGTTWGQGDGSTTFNLPDLRGQHLRGRDTSPFNGTAGVDPDRASRFAKFGGGATGDNVGSYQQYSTGQPTVSGFGIAASGSLDHSHNYLDQVTTSVQSREGGGAGGVMCNPGDALRGSYGVNSSLAHGHGFTGGDSESRGKNAGVYWFIKV